MVSEVEDDLDVVRLCLDGLLEPLERDPPRDQPLEPGEVNAAERLERERVVAEVGVHGAEHDVVLEHERAVERAGVDGQVAADRRDAGEADDACGGVGGDRVEHEPADAASPAW